MATLNHLNRLRLLGTSGGIGVVLVMAVACAPKYTLHLGVPVYRAYEGDFQSAVSALDSTDLARSGKNRLLYHAEKGYLLHLAGEFELSNQELAKAIEAADYLQPPSVTGTVGDYTVSEVLDSYRGEDYERAYLHYYMALNCLMLDKPRDALAKFRRLDEEFRRLFSRYDDDQSYQEDGYVRYLAGLVDESLGEHNDALVEFKLSAACYGGIYGTRIGLRPPEGLFCSLARTARRFRVEDQLHGLVPESVLEQCADEDVTEEIVVLIEHGWISYKQEESIAFPVPRELVPSELRSCSELAAIVKIAYPEMVQASFPAGSYEVSLGTGGYAPGVTVRAEKVMDMDAAAQWAYTRRVEGMKLRSALRATVKQVSLMKAKNALADRIDSLRTELDRTASPLAVLLLNAAIKSSEVALTKLVADTEVADTRCWMLLPREIWMARIPVAPGTYDIQVKANGAAITDSAPRRICVKAGQKAFLVQRVFDRPHPVQARMPAAAASIN